MLAEACAGAGAMHDACWLGKEAVCFERPDVQTASTLTGAIDITAASTEPRLTGELLCARVLPRHCKLAAPAMHLRWKRDSAIQAINKGKDCHDGEARCR